jgi:hypothetical protein
MIIVYGGLLSLFLAIDNDLSWSVDRADGQSY